ncbi:hypothetical protein [cf. Phormidesmis sp. LEGE 11477]|uniref:hypothetical protein n=1 Tax=cf. Phormidesmis sp. LEGE 11477 TaxID=1828680 RepID=UPI0018811E73|nr:hypothetical protein [cf. Phormidesmis sp. LEGE 11477]MBE9061616.1 hypothetical protein [cf. Phormidesmis sp. LEGE 11477]
MIPVGYMFKQVCEKPSWLKAGSVKDLYSVSGCISEDFCDWINEWKHNGYWLFNHPAIMQSIAEQKNISLEKMKLFFYMSSEMEWDEDTRQWGQYQGEKSFETNVKIPEKSKLEGFDIVSFCAHTVCECSPLSCNHLAESIPTNSHCLLSSYKEAKNVVESGVLENCEPGPYRIYEVYSVICV